MAPMMLDHRVVDCRTHCLRCYEACATTLEGCLDRGLMDPVVLRALQDCAATCLLSSDFLLRGSEHHALTCDFCARMCEACAETCATHPGDPDLSACAEACHACAHSCRDMAPVHS
jgi:hypothetical protein